MRTRPLATAAAVALLVGAVAGPAAARGTAASTAAKPAAGTASSALTLLSLALAGHDVKVGTVALTSDTTSGRPVAKVVVTPVNADGKAYGEQTVTPGSSPASIPSFDSSSALPAALGTVASIKSPVFNVSSSNASGASNKAGATSLGSAKILGLPVSLDGTVDVSSLVDGTNALGAKTLTVKNLALPSIADLLAALGLDLSKLPTKTLTDLLAGLKLTDAAVTTAQQALATAQSAVNTQLTAAQKAVDDQQKVLDANKSTLNTALGKVDVSKLQLSQAQAAVTAAQSAFDQATTAQTTAQGQLDAATNTILGSLPLGVTTVAAYLVSPLADPAKVAAYNAANNALTNAKSLVTTTGTNLASAKTAADVANTAVTAAQSAVDAAQQLVTDATTLLNTLLTTLNGLLSQLAPQIKALVAAVTAVLDKTPLVSIDSFTVETQALVKSATAGGQTAKVTGGELQGVHVLGTDVLNNVLGSTKVNLLDLTTGVLAKVTSQVNALTGVLSSVLSAVPGLAVPAPTVQVLTKSATTGIAGGFGNARNTVSALKVSLPAITLPAALALPNAAQLPAFTGVPNLGINAVGDLTSHAMTLSVGTMSEQATFHPATTATTPQTPTTPPTTSPTPELPRTGLPAGIAVFAILLVGGGLVLRRRFAPVTEV